MLENVSQIDEEKIIRKLRWRLIPFLFIIYVVSMMDRVNISFAALDMNKELGISATVFGLIAGIFFVAYFFFEIPSNIMMHKVGCRRWIARILITWGIVTVLTGFIHSAMQLGIMRILLGIAEAGFYPGMILYITLWFPSKYISKTLAFFMTGMALNNIITGPMSTYIMQNVNWLGMSGWRWLFIIEGIPAVICGFITLFWLVDRPEQAKFLTDKEKSWLTQQLKLECEAKRSTSNLSIGKILKNGRVWHMAVIWFGYVCAMYGLSMWVPQIIKSLGQSFSNVQVGLISTIPYFVGVICMVAVGRHSDRAMERRMHVGVPILFSAIGLLALTVTNNIVISLFWIAVSTAGLYGFAGSYWSLPSAFLSEASAAVGIAFINSFGNLGGFVGPYAVGYIKDITGTINSGMYLLAAFAVIAGIATILVPKKLVEIRSNEIRTEIKIKEMIE
ncbi:MFS transporter [Pectinatus haikarae]|uniref:ACS family tartrate transporter-like MFS transporter n=1 Tax=Pectinatus haikarae TaxID=349096 RepID=A0ABT9Y973_9FIRM|nr:MFS transporter [Pectinatus haikarae]MDQ0204381.1 ACS family tartrate transporter-like MFS transporter [Pectinatus haikarae]